MFKFQVIRNLYHHIIVDVFVEKGPDLGRECSTGVPIISTVWSHAAIQTNMGYTWKEIQLRRKTFNSFPFLENVIRYFFSLLLLLKKMKINWNAIKVFNSLDPDLANGFVGLLYIQTVCIGYQQTTVLGEKIKWY